MKSEEHERRAAIRRLEADGWTVTKVAVTVAWPDYVVAVVQVMFVVALLPSIVGSNKPEVLTCAITLAGMLLMMFAFARKSMSFSMVTSGLTALAWLVLLLQVVGR